VVLVISTPSLDAYHILLQPLFFNDVYYQIWLTHILSVQVVVVVSTMSMVFVIGGLLYEIIELHSVFTTMVGEKISTLSTVVALIMT
jgi:hypothetical protein